MATTAQLTPLLRTVCRSRSTHHRRVFDARTLKRLRWITTFSRSDSTPMTTTASPSQLPVHNTSPLRSHSVPATYHQPDPSVVASHLNALFEGLKPRIPADLAIRMLTHKGAVSPNALAAQSLHNSRLSFLGRRIIRLYLAVFFHAHKEMLSASGLKGEILNDEMLETMVDTYKLGQHIATRWQLEQHLHWRQMTGPDGRPTGLYKVSGVAVEAIVGGIFRQYGAATAMQVFNSRLLPFLPLPAILVRPAMHLGNLHKELSSPLNSARDDPINVEAVAEIEDHDRRETIAGLAG